MNILQKFQFGHAIIAILPIHMNHVTIVAQQEVYVLNADTHLLVRLKALENAIPMVDPF